MIKLTKKTCSKCKQSLNSKHFRKDKSKKDGYYSSCKMCYTQDNPYNKEYMTNKNVVYYQKNRDSILNKKSQDRKINFCKYILLNIKGRCTCNKHPNYHRYGGRGIKCLITLEEVKKLWFRDKAYLLDKPSIDREDNDGDYTYNNCRFIEHAENCVKDHRKPVLQFDLDGNFIREWISAKDVERNLNIANCCVLGCCHFTKGYKTAGGFIWRFKL